ncbi:hypothetical protein Phum_PHUM077860 [Pediculus humanus corporis]|uniref:Cilia- and flagella-associated protein 91 n=1 Tax=Pediculus humanus subsp. corporis TaxID=121224 RepID=E0VC24_PEDHC|nr:uncharacterized protein Phum_PHUM077860 [Pediculus humanus corporis]EEB10930.1 hypothetical protein Phum_PHUM077860 [Pediculus humanus corporis]
MKSIEDKKNTMKVEGSHRTLFYRQFASTCTKVLVSLVENDRGDNVKKVVCFENKNFPKTNDSEGKKKEMIITLPIKSTKTVTKSVQTDYRESETQTLPWRHEIIADKKILNEYLSLDFLNLKEENNFLPGRDDIILIKHAREKSAWENILNELKGKETEKIRKFIIYRISTVESYMKEKKTNEINEERINLSREIMKEEKKIFTDNLINKLER